MLWLQSPSTVIVEPKKDPLEKGMATHSSVFAWRIPWTEEPGRLHSMGSQRVGHDRVTNTHTHINKYYILIGFLGNPTGRGAWWALFHGVARVGHD